MFSKATTGKVLHSWAVMSDSQTPENKEQANGNIVREWPEWGSFIKKIALLFSVRVGLNAPSEEKPLIWSLLTAAHS